MASENIQTALSPGHLLSEERVLRISPSPTSEKVENIKLKVYNKTVRFATWNVRSLFMGGKLANVENEMCRLKIDILGLSEVRWPGSGRQITRNGLIYYSGSDDKDHRYGTAILISNSIAKSVIDFVPLSDRVVFLKLQTSHRSLNIIQVYAPTSDKPDEEVEDFYLTVDEALRLTKKGEITVVMGDLNAKIGCGAEVDVVGAYGLGDRNKRGDRLVQFCVENDLFIANTCFKQHPRRLYTWKSPADCPGNIVRNQIDFIMLGLMYKKYVKTVTTYPGADVCSDHNPVVMDFKLRRLTAVKKSKAPRKVYVGSLKDVHLREQIGAELEKKMQEIHAEESQRIRVEETWCRMRDALHSIQVEHIGFTESQKRQEWMTDEILALMGERRKYKSANLERYKNLNKVIRRKCREAKEEWLSKKCEEIEGLQDKFDTFNVHRKVKEMTNKRHKYHVTNLKDENNLYIVGVEAKLLAMKKYVEELFQDNRPDEAPAPDSTINENGPRITNSEVIHAIKAQKNRKAVGPDEIYIETVKLLAEQGGKGLDLLTSLFNGIYKTGTVPSDWLKSIFIPIPKKPSSSHCDEYRFISLMSHVLKVFLRIIHTRIYRKCEFLLEDTQFGFQNGVGTREALFSLNVLTQRCRDMNVEVYGCFIDYRKAFDSLKHDKMIEILRATGIDREEINLVSSLYWRQTAVVRMEQSTSEEVLIEKGVRQGCILSPLLFNLYSEAIFKEALDSVDKGIKVNGVCINNLRYADDTVILAENIDDLQHITDRIVQHSEAYGLSLNIAKTKVMVFSKKRINVDFRIRGEKVEQVATFKYLGAQINEQTDPRKEIRARIEMARRTFLQMRKFFIRADLSLTLRLRMIRCYVYSVLLYGCESWTLDSGTEGNLEAFEMYLYRRMLRIPWTQKVSNCEVLRRMGKPKELLLTVKERKTRYIGHIMRGDKYELLRLIIEGKIQGKRSAGRRKNSWLKDLRRWFHCTSGEIFRVAVCKKQLAAWIANLRKEKAD